MPTWLVPTLKWGGIALAIISVIALIYVQMAPAPETGEAVSEAPTTLYWILLVIGVVGAIAGFVMDRRQRPT